MPSSPTLDRPTLNPTAAKAQPAAARIPITRRTHCSACGGTGLEEILSLPNLPLTGIFIEPHTRRDFPSFDQALLRCPACGHGQLRDSIDPAYLYQETYTHRSSLSPISTRGNDFFLNFLNDVAGDRHFESIAEIGCNDLYLLKKLAPRATHLTGFDPIWKDHSPVEPGPIHVLGKYVEEIAPAADLPVRPDLVLSVHTLEHVNDPLESLRPIYAHARPGALFLIEVPSLDTLVTINRFDQIFHQHLNYFSLASCQRMVRSLGGEFITHRHNYGYWLGTMMVAFRKPTGAAAPALVAAVPPSTAEIQARYVLYRRQLEGVLANLLHLVKGGTPAVGFGAAQMVPTLAYHMQTDLGFLDGILDDNPDKAGRTYPSIATTIRPTGDFPDLRSHAVLLTACDSARVLLPRCTSLGARYLLVPNNPF